MDVLFFNVVLRAHEGAPCFILQRAAAAALKRGEGCNRTINLVESFVTLRREISCVERPRQLVELGGDTRIAHRVQDRKLLGQVKCHCTKCPVILGQQVFEKVLPASNGQRENSLAPMWRVMDKHKRKKSNK